MLKWRDIDEKYDDRQLDYKGRCIVVDYPFDPERDRRPPEVCEQIATILNLWAMLDDTVAVRLQDDGDLAVAIERKDPEDQYRSLAYRNSWSGRWTHV